MNDQDVTDVTSSPDIAHTHCQVVVWGPEAVSYSVTGPAHSIGSGTQVDGQ